MKIAVLPQDDKSRSKPFYSLLVGLGYTQGIWYIYRSICMISYGKRMQVNIPYMDPYNGNIYLHNLP